MTARRQRRAVTMKRYLTHQSGRESGVAPGIYLTILGLSSGVVKGNLHVVWRRIVQNRAPGTDVAQT